MLGVGYGEVFIVLVVALVVFGPSRLPELAGQVGRWVRDFRRMTADLTEEFEKTVAEADDIRRVVTGEVDSMRSQVANVGTSVKKDLKGTGKAGSAAAKKPIGAATAGKKPTVASVGGTGLKKPTTAGAVKTGSVASKPAAAPVATKADPLADVSFLDDEPEMPVNGRPIGSPAAIGGNGRAGAVPKAKAPTNGASADARAKDASAVEPGGPQDEALARARRRRAAAGYSRRG
jgi:sec-independent protein translocase protein TatA